MITHVLDTSAILAHYLHESGAEDVNAVLTKGPEVSGISLVTLVELRSRLAELESDANEAERIFKLYTETLTTRFAVHARDCGLRDGIALRHTPSIAIGGRVDCSECKAAWRNSRSSRPAHGSDTIVIGQPADIAAQEMKRAYRYCEYLAGTGRVVLTNPDVF